MYDRMQQSPESPRLPVFSANAATLAQDGTNHRRNPGSLQTPSASPAQNSMRMPDGTTRAFHYYPAPSDTTMLLLCAAQTAYGAHVRDPEAFAEYLSGDGLTKVVLPVSMPQTAHAMHMWIAAVCAALPNEPVIVGTIDGANTLRIEVASDYYGGDCVSPEPQFLHTRDGSTMAYRYFAAAALTVVVLMHGGASHSTPYLPLAKFISGRGLAQVYTPNLRGHYLSGSARGDVGYIGQMEDDLADLIRHIRQQTPNARIVLAGHSWGGGLVIRFAGGPYASLVDGGVLFSPYPGPAMDVFRQTASGGWASCAIPRVIGLALLNCLGVTRLNHLRVVHFQLPGVVNDDMATLDYTYRAFVSFSPHWLYWQNLKRMSQPVLALLGETDGVFDAERLGNLLKLCPRARVHIVPNASHMGVVFNKQAHNVLADWLEALDEPQD